MDGLLQPGFEGKQTAPEFAPTQSERALRTEVLLLFQAVGVHGWLVVGEGLPTVRVQPVQQCQKHCSSFNLWLNSGDMGNFQTL